jgi:L-fucose isomerase-like protein
MKENRKELRELPKPRVGMFVVSDKYLNALNDFAMRVARNIVEHLESRGITVLFDETVLTTQRVAEKAALSMVGQDLDTYIIYLPTWSEAPTAVAIVRELERTPFLLWGFNMWEDEQGRRDTTGSVVGELVLKGTFERMGYEFKFVAGFPEDEPTLSGAVDYILAARARKLLKRVRFGHLGYTGIGMYPGTFDHLLMRSIIGPEIVPIPECEFQDAVEAVNETEARKLLAYIRDNLDVTKVSNQETLTRTARIYLAARKVIEDYELDGLNMRCHYDFSKRLRCTCCFPLSLLSDERIVTGCEGDIVTSISMFIFDLLSDSVVTYGDILDFDRERNLTMFSACGLAVGCG